MQKSPDFSGLFVFCGGACHLIIEERLARSEEKLENLEKGQSELRTDIKELIETLRLYIEKEQRSLDDRLSRVENILLKCVLGALSSLVIGFVTYIGNHIFGGIR